MYVSYLVRKGDATFISFLTQSDLLFILHISKPSLITIVFVSIKLVNYVGTCDVFCSFVFSRPSWQPSRPEG